MSAPLNDVAAPDTNASPAVRRSRPDIGLAERRGAPAPILELIALDVADAPWSAARFGEASAV